MIIYKKKRGNKMMYDIFDDQKTLNLWAKKCWMIKLWSEL